MNKPEPEFPDTDPLIDEVRAIRKSLSDRFNNDVGQLCDHLRQVENQYEERLERHPGHKASPPAKS